MRVWSWAFTLILAAALILNMASASLDCFLCPPLTCPVDPLEGGVNILNISDEYNAHIGPAAIEVRCKDLSDGTLSNSGTDTYNATVIRITDLQNGHAERGDSSDYPYLFNLSSSNKKVECFYRSDCQSNEACVISLSAGTNAHVGECSQYGLKVCCTTKDTEGPSCSVSSPEWAKGPFEVSWVCTDVSGVVDRYNVQNNATWSDGRPFSAWTDWLTNVDYKSDDFATAQNNKTYYFRVNATDTDGNIGDWSAPNRTTYDDEKPSISYSVGNNEDAHQVTIYSWAWDNISGIAEHSIDCIIKNPEGSEAKACLPADPFGGISPCQTDPISYFEHTAIECALKAKDRAGNEMEKEIFYTPLTDHPLAEFADHEIFIGLGEIQHGKIYVRNLNSSWDEINVSLNGTYPSGLAKFVDTPLAKRTSDGKNVSVPLDAYEQKTLYVEIVSTGAGEYTLGLMAKSKTSLLTDSDEMKIAVGFNTAFPGFEAMSALMLVALSAFAYWKTRKD